MDALLLTQCRSEPNSATPSARRASSRSASPSRPPSWPRSARSTTACSSARRRSAKTGRTPFDYVPLLQLQSPVLRRFATSPALVEPLLELLGPDVRLYWDQAVAKPPGASSDTPWHQDNGYGAVEPAEYVTTTLALDAMTLANGCLWIQPGSQRRGPSAHRDTGGFFQVGYEGRDAGVPCELEAGEVLAFSSLTMHRAGPNPTQGGGARG